MSLGALTINLLISLYCALSILRNYQYPKYISGLNILLLLFTIYGFCFIFFGQSVAINLPTTGLIYVKNYSYLKGIYISLLPIYAFYYFTEKGFLTESKIRKWTVIFFLCALYMYFKILSETIESFGAADEEVQNNGGYLFLSMLPLLVFFNKRPVVMLILLTLFESFIIISAKRGAILIGVIVLLFIIWKMESIIGSQYRKLKFFFIITILIAVYFFTWSFLEEDSLLYMRFEDTLEGRTSGRDILYTVFSNYFLFDTNAWQFIVGSGAWSTLRIQGQFAHSDWLEIAVNQGCTGLIVYMIYWWFFIITCYKSYRDDYISIGIVMVAFIFFLESIFSMSYSDMTIYSTIVLGFCLAKLYPQQKKEVKTINFVKP